LGIFGVGCEVETVVSVIVFGIEIRFSISSKKMCMALILVNVLVLFCHRIDCSLFVRAVAPKKLIRSSRA